MQLILHFSADTGAELARNISNYCDDNDVKVESISYSLSTRTHHAIVVFMR